MKVLFDHNVDRRFRRHLEGHDIQTAREMNWDKLENGELLKAAANAGFDVIITVDKKIEHEQNLGTLPIPIVLIDSHSNALASLRLFDKPVLELLSNPIDRALWIVQNDGKVLRLTEPRQ